MKYIIVIILICIINELYSQESDKDSVKMSFSLDKEITISANKTVELKKNISQQVQVISAKEISASQSQSTADLLSNTGNVFVQKSQMGGGSPVLRGFEASRIVLVVDGIRLNNIIYRSGHLQNIITLDNASLDRMEVLHGSSSLIYGSDALGGVIHMYTLKPSLRVDSFASKIKVNAGFRYGSVNNEISSHVDFNIGFKSFASLTSITFSKFGDLLSGKNQNPFYKNSYIDRQYYVENINGKDSVVKSGNRFLQKFSGYQQYDILQKLLYKPSNRISHGLNIQFSNSGNIPRYDRLTDMSGSVLKYAEWYYGPQTRLLTAYDFDLSDSLTFFNKIHVGVNYQYIVESRHIRNYGKSTRKNNFEKVGIFGFDADFYKKLGTHNLHAGIDGQHNNLKSTAHNEDIYSGVKSPLLTRYPDGQNTLLNLGIYLSHSYRINEYFLINDGARIGYSSLHSEIKDTTLLKLPYNEVNQQMPVYSASAGIVNTPSDDLKFSLSVSTAFRVPNVDDLSKIFESAPGTVIVPNTMLKPEQTVSTDLGFTKLFSDKVIIESTVYYTIFNDAIVTDKFQFNGSDKIIYDGILSQVYANQNKKRAYLYGYSGSIKAILNEFIQFNVALNYTYGRIKTDTSDYPLDHIPPLTAKAQLVYMFKGFTGDIFVNYHSWKRLEDYNMGGEDNHQYATIDGTPAWLTLNFRATYQCKKYFSFTLGVDNVFDTKYRVFASGINGPGRNIFASVKYKL